MTDLLRRSRSVGIALAVLAISASVALAAAPPAARISSHETLTANEESETPEASETAKPTHSPEASETAEPAESPEAPDAAKAAEAAESPGTSQDAHGALVSVAAKMVTPPGFRNHGAFVSCVAHLDATLATIVWTTVTPESCGTTASDKAAKSAEKTAAAKVKADAGKAKGAAARAAHGKSKHHGGSNR